MIITRVHSVSDEEDKLRRERIARYFGPGLNTSRMIQIAAVLLIIGILLLLSKQPLGTILIVVAFYPIGRIVFFKLFRKISDEEIDSYLREDLMAMSHNASQKLKLGDPDSQDQLQIEQPFVLIGAIIDEKTGRVQSDIISREGDDGKTRYPQNRVTVFVPTKNILGVYVCDFDSIQNATLNEKSFECYYRDIVTFVVEELNVHTDLSRLLHTFADITGQRKLKDVSIIGKDENALINIKFYLSLTSGEKTGSIINIRRDSDGRGNYKPHFVDSQINAIRLMLRERKKLGTQGYAITTQEE